MKPFLALDKTKKQDKAMLNGAEFKVQEVPMELFRKYRKISENNRQLKAKAELPNILRIAQVFFGLGSLICLFSLFTAFYDKGAVDHQNCIDKILGVFICAVIFAVSYFYGNYRKKKILESDEAKNNNVLISEVVKELEESLEVPENAATTEILAFAYKVTGENCEIITDKSGYKKADNCKFKMYEEDGSLIFCALDKKFAFPMDSIKELIKVKEELLLSYWHKTSPYNSEDYKEYKLKRENGKIIINEYLSLILIIENGEEKSAWTINFPIYEIKTVEQITNLKAK